MRVRKWVYGDEVCWGVIILTKWVNKCIDKRDPRLLKSIKERFQKSQTLICGVIHHKIYRVQIYLQRPGFIVVKLFFWWKQEHTISTGPSLDSFMNSWDLDENWVTILPAKDIVSKLNTIDAGMKNKHRIYISLILLNLSIELPQYVQSPILHDHNEPTTDFTSNTIGKSTSVSGAKFRAKS